QIRSDVQAGNLPLPRSLRPDVPASLDRICRRALSLRRADRHATALELADDLEKGLAELGTPVTPREIGGTVVRLFADVRRETREAIEQKLGRLTPAEGVRAPDRDATPAPGTAPRSRRRLWLPVAGAVAAALAGLGVWRSLSSGDRRTAPEGPPSV